MGKRRVTPEELAECAVRYRMGESLFSIAMDKGIPETTLRRRKAEQGWTQDWKSDVTDIKEKINKMANSCSDDQMPYAQSKLDEILQIQKAVNSFVKGAVNLNMKNLQAVLNEPDAEKRINLTAKMRANMIDLAGIVRPALQAPEEIEKEDKQITFNIMPVEIIDGHIPKSNQ